ncbi:hypothetical protein FEF09_03505 [Chitinophaga pinensis]|uniref:Glycosyl-hydrolase 97 N-terminal domain-containing protein n=1 Tax=Chitinophaga pinensis TaxID=79329 RepID=A0A5C6LXW7_9BACT|nr:hypothetical protein FEF09_03505 [Chitinophaga pinensis]
MIRHKYLKGFLICICSLFSVNALPQSVILLKSPDNNLTIEINTKDSLSWRLTKGKKILLQRAIAGIDIENNAYIGFDERVKSTKRTTKNELLHPLVAVRQSVISDIYNELTIDLKSGHTIVFRAYDNGVAYRWITHFKDSINVKNEIVDYLFPDNNRVLWGVEENNNSFPISSCCLKTLHWLHFHMNNIAAFRYICLHLRVQKCFSVKLICWIILICFSLVQAVIRLPVAFPK